MKKPGKPGFFHARLSLYPFEPELAPPLALSQTRRDDSNAAGLSQGPAF
jgi:hypothetical protein